MLSLCLSHPLARQLCCVLEPEGLSMCRFLQSSTGDVGGYTDDYTSGAFEEIVFSEWCKA